MVIPNLVAQAIENKPLTVFGDGKQTRCFTYVGDVVPALIKLMDSSQVNGEVFNIGSNHPVSIETLAQRIIERSGSTSTIQYIPYQEAYGVGYEDMRHRAPCLQKIRDAIGYEPTTSLDMILDTVIASMRERGSR
jgi:UDP-glucose 4-epimerase